MFLGTDSAYNMPMSMNNKQHIKGGSIMTNENINNLLKTNDFNGDIEKIIKEALKELNS